MGFELEGDDGGNARLDEVLRQSEIRNELES